MLEMLKNDPDWRKKKPENQPSGCKYRGGIKECPADDCGFCGFCPDVEGQRIAKLRQDFAYKQDVEEGNIGIAVHFVRHRDYARQLNVTRRGYR